MDILLFVYEEGMASGPKGTLSFLLFPKTSVLSVMLFEMSLFNKRKLIVLL
jgi:hypothetical protein